MSCCSARCVVLCCVDEIVERVYNISWLYMLVLTRVRSCNAHTIQNTRNLRARSCAWIWWGSRGESGTRLYCQKICDANIMNHIALCTPALQHKLYSFSVFDKHNYYGLISKECPSTIYVS